MSELSHVDEATGDVRMVDVGGKPLSRRRAVARARVRMAETTAARLRSLPKGDALTVARVAGIQAAKRTSELIPLCHPLPLTSIEVDLTVGAEGVAIEAAAETLVAECDRLEDGGLTAVIRSGKDCERWKSHAGRVERLEAVDSCANEAGRRRGLIEKPCRVEIRGRIVLVE